MEALNDDFIVHDAIETSLAYVPMIQAVNADKLMNTDFAPLLEPVQGLIVEGLTLLCGSTKIGKSWLMLQMCAAVASGTPFLGRRTEIGSVLYCAFEDSQRRLKDRMQRQGIIANENLQFSINIITLEGGLLDALDGWIMNNPSARLIVIDTLQKIRGQISGRANMYADDYKAMAKLKSFADRHHIAVAAVHHLNKLKDTEDPYDKISGSTGLMGAADTTILVDRKRGETDATVSFTGRDVYGDDFRIRFENCQWKVCDPAMLERERYEKSPVVIAVRQFIKQASYDGTWACSYADFKDWAAERGLFVGAKQGDVHKSLLAVENLLSVYDGISISFDKRVGKGLGFRLTKRGEITHG